jgi:ribonuclease-3
MSGELENKLAYRFKNMELLTNALTHKSYHEGLQGFEDLPNNEKLEFLGDSVINLVVTEYLFRRFKKFSEGELSKLKAHLVSSNFLFKVARSVDLGDYVLLGKGEEKNEGRNNRRIIASLFEAVVGAIYLDSNYRVVSNTIISFFKDFIEQFIEDKEAIKINDYKSELQEIIQRHHNLLPEYRVLSETGKPPHTIFTAVIFLEGQEISRGQGKNKRQAEQDAAYNALKKLDNVLNYEKLSEVFFLKND